MPIEVPRATVEHMLLGAPNDRRQLQDSPILGDVWIAFAKKPADAADLLITPHKSKLASEVASAINRRLKEERQRDAKPRPDPEVAFLQAVVAARLKFDQLLQVIVPMTGWWHEPRNRQEFNLYFDPARPEAISEKLRRALEYMLQIACGRSRGPGTDSFSTLDKYVGLAALILWAGEAQPRKGARKGTAEEEIQRALEKVKVDAVARPLLQLLNAMRQPDAPLVFQISLNRTATAAVARSVPAVKGDAAKLLFAVNCGDINWAVLDSGIDATHPAFQKEKPKPNEKPSRVKASYDFSQFRQIVSLSNEDDETRAHNAMKLSRYDPNQPLKPEEQKNLAKIDGDLAQIADDVDKGRRLNWPLIEQIVTLPDGTAPLSNHGTHVAGIIGANSAKLRQAGLDSDIGDGMCPDIGLYDFRVMGPTLEDTEFAIIAALQYIRYLNERHRFTVIHGANLSLSIRHDVRNYACGRTPVCLESEQLVDSGVVVVAAAGNRGYQSFETKEGPFESYASFSITDPGNADGVITVGSTHRNSPHTYGVSFFSSRGPTGDGRPKPDLVAPGERIRSTAPVAAGGPWTDLDGTSMAAPHVSGAAAMLMARYSELIGQPRRIKKILCESATDLGRERSFQGHGMLDVLRAFQRV